jgi:hypothetical protein
LRCGIFVAVSLLFGYRLSLIYRYRFDHLYNNPIPLGLIIFILISGLVDFDQIIFLADWQWLSFWMPFGLAFAAKRATGRIGMPLAKSLNARGCFS